MIIKVVVAGHTEEGPELFFCKVDCSPEQFDQEHYRVAERAARENGYEGCLVAIDEYDNPTTLFGLFNWDAAKTYKA